ncbi:MAG: type II toxin-antitoxin system HigB family toxin [Akkermansiaceae bacterium]
MHISTRRRLTEYASKHPNAAASLSAWHNVAKAARWKSISEVRQTFPHADAAQVASGKTVTIFNIAGNNHRLVTAIHYNTGKVFILKILTHAQYDKPHWKKEL